MDFGQIRVLPGEEFDDLDTGEELLEKFGTLIGKNHGLSTETEQETHKFGLYRYHNEEDGETGQSTRTQVDQEDDQTDDQLNWGGPGGMEELASEVDTRNVGRNMVDEFSVRVDMPSTSGKFESLVIDRGDQSSAQQDTSTHGAVEEVVHSQGR